MAHSVCAQGFESKSLRGTFKAHLEYLIKLSCLDRTKTTAFWTVIWSIFFMSFNDLGLSAELLRAISDQGYDTPTPIQRQAIPVILEGRDVMAAAQTGTGKTAGFTLPLLQRLNNGVKPAKGVIRALVLAPTRELAAQVEESVRTYGKHLPLRSVAIFGGVNINPQFKSLRNGVDILVATPGRLMDHVQQKTIDLSKIEILVLDEADRMLDMGFIPEVRRILALLPKVRQNLLFSATFSPEIKRLADGIMQKPALIEIDRKNVSAELIAQVVHPVEQKQKRGLLSFLISSNNWQQVLVFMRTKHSADRVAKQLQLDGLKAVAIHGNKSQGARTRALEDFKSGKMRVLVATDIAARGLDIDQLPHVVNYDLPNIPEDYVHRIGRTGRAGNEGRAISLVSAEEHKLLKDIERLIGREIPREKVWEYAAASWGYGDPGVVQTATRPDEEETRQRQSRPNTRRRPQSGDRRSNSSARHSKPREESSRSNSSARPAQQRDGSGRSNSSSRQGQPQGDNRRSNSSSRHSQRQADGRRSHSAPRDAQSQVQSREAGAPATSQKNFTKQNTRSRRKRNSGPREVSALLG
jgi:ATP-dependent RNA helicase RhlE